VAINFVLVAIVVGTVVAVLDLFVVIISGPGILEAYLRVMSGKSGKCLDSR